MPVRPVGTIENGPRNARLRPSLRDLEYCPYLAHLPSSKLLGYYQTSLRDEQPHADLCVTTRAPPVSPETPSPFGAAAGHSLMRRDPPAALSAQNSSGDCPSIRKFCKMRVGRKEGPPNSEPPCPLTPDPCPLFPSTHMIRVGIAGIGFMGMIHYLAYQKIRGVKVAALCEQDAEAAGRRLADDQGQLRPAGPDDGPGGHRPLRRARRAAGRSEARPDRHLPAAGLARQGDDRRPAGRQARLLREADRAESGRRRPHGRRRPSRRASCC